ncbi:MAG: BON domain-containing protein [Sideroxydans sp.]|nr:BON domain-containing protein [Sideroxydans sp.]
MRYLNYLLFAALLAALQGCFPVVATGVGTGVLMAADRRTTGTYIEDQEIESKASGRVAREYHDKVHVNITSFNRHVLVTGEVPDDATRTGVERIVASVANVKAVSNELVIAGLSSLSSRGSDTVITGDVKLRFLDNKNAFNPDHVKVVTEDGTVYLMGLVFHKEADAAAEIASTTSGVQRVVKVFEYLD